MKPTRLSDFEVLAQEKLSAMAYDYFAGGAHHETTLRENTAAWARMWLHYRVLVDVTHRCIETYLLDVPRASPFIVAPTAFHGLAHAQAECATVAGAHAADAIFIASTLSNRSIEDIVSASIGAVWFQLYIYKDRDLTRQLVRRAECAGCEALVLTVDAAEIGTRYRDEHNAFTLPSHLQLGNLIGTDKAALGPGGQRSSLSHYVRQQLDASLTWADLTWLVETTQLPVFVKGIVRPDDAQRAVARGARGVIVSNHGGRQLDTAPPTAHVLKSIADAVGHQVDVLVDGGIRTGRDAMKALALGARGILIGRPVLWGLAAEGVPGVRRVFEILEHELREAMALSGCPNLPSIGPWLLGQGDPAEPPRS
ncbi:MAG: alpha-hydroxy acid oxidase [Myxococcota bacterium]|nr:alpha-hydroxy acid oxidase [Myxococcota bacterium]